MNLRRISALEEIDREIVRIREREGVWRTNLFASESRLSRWCGQGRLFLGSTEESFFLLHKREAFYHSFFCTVNLMDAGAALDAFAREIGKPISMDVLGEDKEMRTMLEQAGFYCAITLKRMILPNNDTEAENLFVAETEYARPEELPFLMEQLQKIFDPLTKQLPDEEEFLRMIEQKNVFVLRTPENRIAGFSAFEIQGLVVVLRFIAVMGEWRGKGLGDVLLKKYLGIRHGVCKHQHWVKSDNLPAVRLYEKYGFRFDGLRDDVYVYQP